jgi:hypothetical protein
MARRNQNTFLKRQKEMERVRKAKEKMARRQGKVITEEAPPRVSMFDEPSAEPGEATVSEESSQEPDGEGADDTSPDN